MRGRSNCIIFYFFSTTYSSILIGTKKPVYFDLTLVFALTGGDIAGVILDLVAEETLFSWE
jgi:hypothetical protein